MAVHQSQRRLVNFLLQPVVQLRLGLVNIALSVTFVGALGAYGYYKFVQFADVIAVLTSASDEVQKLVRDYLASVGISALIGSVVFILINLCASIYITHKLVGPTVAFRRHIHGLMQGNFKVKTRLRKGDAFGEVAEDLNQLSEKLTDMKLT